MLGRREGWSSAATAVRRQGNEGTDVESIGGVKPYVPPKVKEKETDPAEEDAKKRKK